MRTDDFDFELPPELIAQHPADQRDHSRLLVASIDRKSWEHKHFYDLVDELHAGDVLVMNNTRVIPARLFGTKEETFAHVELLILNMDDPMHVECLVGNAKVVKVGTRVFFGNHQLVAQCVEIGSEGLRYFKMIYEGVFLEVLEALGQTPLPPYIQETLVDPERYQTVYAKVNGSAAAPTAGLHFTSDILKQLQLKGVELVEVTLHVGLGTFRPVSVENALDHHMHHERYEMSQEAANALNLARLQHRRIIAVGTTSVRVLETVFRDFGQFEAAQGSTDIFIYPGFKYQAISGLITNFHLPKSTLMMLVSAFATKPFIFDLYHEAIQNEYRFFSFGDSMFLKFDEAQYDQDQ